MTVVAIVVTAWVLLVAPAIALALGKAARVAEARERADRQRSTRALTELLEQSAPPRGAA
ncbi:hypothetical protein [Modestobacter sp. VKM Ac-2985]|uniref:hypothetical protein n=1 Tax=Modestobacter sp. VKM Ac-2985 TaxID=3004139 RepID=UPI0022AB6368|nr:hypothetical protein [Modestobacter sp. VKM Ac-2985]MCZ2837176.1 hypothetical protein [Modestobacter sp. VKM Ac-2985]